MRRWIEAAAGPPPPAVDRFATFTYGLAQPLLGLRMLRRHPELLRPALLPVVLVTIFCALSAVGGPHPTVGGMVVRFYAALAGAASAPPFLFADRYARVAARAHERLGLGPAEPRLTRFMPRLRQLLRFALVIALPIAPVLWIVGAVPFAGAAAAYVVSAAWTLHWIVVEALDGARVAGAPGAAPPEWPWFLAWAGRPGFADLPGLVRRPLGWAARRVRALTRPWHEEAALAAANPILSTGFGLAVAGLLAVPVVNLLLRPAVLIGGVHLLARVRAAAPVAAGSTVTSTVASAGP
ncbi:MAG TPA: hypothetical protein VK698_38540 [Kofleriaceae bacterium]|nr:hypothetical protein [Kofleriaceae bacterium]